MSTPAPSPTSKAPPGPIAPPDDQFWEKYSPHYEFPLSSIGSIAAHVAGIAIFLLLLWLLSRLSITDTKPVPMIGITVDGDGSGENGSGSGGGDPMPMENVNPLVKPMDPPARPTDAQLEKIKPFEKFTPNVPSNDEGLKPEDLDTLRKIAKLNEDLQKALLDGMNRKRGKGPGEGSGNSGVPGKGSGSTGDPTSSGNRAIRWELNFKTTSGKDYVEQLAVMKATLVIPEADGNTNKVYRDLLNNPVGQPFDRKELPDLYFVDDDSGSAEKVAKYLGLKHLPNMFIAFFPKDIEEELARKERDYRGRKESEIFSTKFKIMIRNNKPTIEVVDQTPVKR